MTVLIAQSFSHSYGRFCVWANWWTLGFRLMFWGRGFMFLSLLEMVFLNLVWGDCRMATLGEEIMLEIDVVSGNRKGCRSCCRSTLWLSSLCGTLYWCLFYVTRLRTRKLWKSEVADRLHGRASWMRLLKSSFLFLFFCYSFRLFFKGSSLAKGREVNQQAWR